MTTRTSLGLKIVDDAGQAGAGIYIGGYQIAPDVLLIRADSFESAWQAMVDESFGGRDLVPPCP